MTDTAPLPDDEAEVLRRFVREFTSKPERRDWFKPVPWQPIRYDAVKFTLPLSAVPSLTKAGTWPICAPSPCMCLAADKPWKVPRGVWNVIKEVDPDIQEVRIYFEYDFYLLYSSPTPNSIEVVLSYGWDFA